ncbi:MAG: type III pantothenate kinase [Planctomycetota bacterium]|nr:MAG: type III pantothenate kinase [Planctomycetota bacterium]
MDSVLLVIDCGNTRYKYLQRRQGGRCTALQTAVQPSLILDAVPPSRSTILLAGAARQVQAVIHDARRLGWLQHQIHILGDDIPLPEMGQYARCGIDRCCAGWAAARDESAIVCDFGTATTITAWRQGPQFLGGVILPGYRACLAGLHRAAPALPNIAQQLQDQDSHESINPLADNTEAALLAGMQMGYPAMVEACLQEIRRSSGIDRVVASGGGMEIIPTAMSQDWHVDKSLVLRGMMSLYDGSAA